MTALASNQIPRKFLNGYGQETRRPRAGTYATGQQGYLNSLTIEVDGNGGRPLVSGTALQALCLNAGAGASNGGIFMRARRAGITVTVTSGAAESVVVTYSGTTINFNVTFNNGTSTATTITTLLRGNAEFNRYVVFAVQGSGAGSPTAMTVTAVPYIALIGVASEAINNSAGGSPLLLDPWYHFVIGAFGLTPDPANVPQVNSRAYLIDDNTISAAVDPLAFTARVVQVDAQGLAYADLMEAY